MPVVVLADIDHRLINAINLAGLVLGIFGSLFFTYDLLGRPGGPLRLFIRIVIPALLGALVFAGLTYLAFHLITPTEDPTIVLDELLIFAALGASVGTFNGLFVDAPDVIKKHRFFFSLRDALVGLVTVVAYLWLALLILALVVRGPLIALLSTENAVFTLAAGGVGALLAGIWRTINRSRAAAVSRPRLFSGKGCLIGIGTAVLLCGVTLLISLGVATGSLTASEIIGIIILVVLSGVPGGGITGGISRYIFWWANDLPPRGLEVIGIFLILVAFVAQSIEPALGLLNVAVK